MDTTQLGFLKMVNIPPPHMRRAAIKSQVGGVHDGSRTRNPDLRLTQTLRLGTNHWTTGPVGHGYHLKKL
ncbi:hypothetical protein SLEP1_g57869 [Rubroshorea leprosula]|uniref:Uncharacterized protein n=1 Tax=Rubroshorea leprosula TaxID=152421 RepID=A0AAV5MQS9_9ROSI|nr:hypothetical protein SLEP1_g57869 [Rubroshorea leprosula]